MVSYYYYYYYYYWSKFFIRQDLLHSLLIKTTGIVGTALIVSYFTSLKNKITKNKEQTKMQKQRQNN